MFDLDGTLVDSLDDIVAATNFVRHDFDGRAPLDRETVQRYIGYGAVYLLENALPIGTDTPDLPAPPPTPEDIQRGLALFKKFYAQHGLNYTRPYAGIADMLDAIADTPITTAILSNKPHAAVELVVDAIFTDRNFTAVFGQREGIPPKPDPEAALSIAREINIPAPRWIYIGDSEVDVQTGRAAGMYTVAVTWGFRDRQTLAEQKPDAIIDHPRDLLPILGL